MVDEGSEPVEATKVELTAEVVSAALSEIPVGGGILSAVAKGFVERRQNRRLNKFLVDLAADLRALEDRVNQEFVGSEEFEDLAEEVFSRATDTRSQARLDAFRALFLNTVIAKKPGYEDAAEVAALVDGFQERHIVLLRILADPLRADRELGNPVGEGGGFSTSFARILGTLLSEWDQDQIERTWENLGAWRLHNSGGIAGMMTDRGIHQLEGRLTEFGMKVTSYITTPVTSEA